MNGPVAKRIETISPSRAADLDACMLRVAFGQHATRAGEPSDPQVIGDAAHAVLESLVNDGTILGANAGAEAVTRFKNELLARVPDREVRRARPATARLRKIAEYLAEVVTRAAPGATVLCEARLKAHGGAASGVVDLIIESPTVHVVVDYKTGTAVDERGDIRARYAAQLRFYAALEHARSGRWPDTSLLVPFSGSPVELSVLPEECERELIAAVTARDSFNELTGTVPPASPSEETCRFCTHAPRCIAFWRRVTAAASWDHAAVRGPVISVEASGAGATTIAMDSQAGTHLGPVVIRGIEAEARDLPSPDGTLSVCGLHEDADGRLVASRITRWARVAP